MGFAGEDIMTGGAGSDAFKYALHDLDGSNDHITDFHFGADGDNLDLSSLFAGETPQQLVDDGHLSIDPTVDPSILNVTIDADGDSNTTSDLVHVELHLDTTPADVDAAIDSILNNNIKTEMP